MQLLCLALGVLAVAAAGERSAPTELQIGVKHRPEECAVRTKGGDTVSVHYTGTLFSDGTEFDSSRKRGVPIEFVLGRGQVIQGWDQGLLDMCVGERRRLKIPARLGYGSRGAPPLIPKDAALVFDTELVAINGRGAGHQEL
ncbi:hypothetical protein H4R18_001343 [Coemansia javaensis]|uniref:peptidylprolyl isomerase n=1 Tax=Coemansia javaensis TaxID=2761396 RepID=A0A9W8HLR5_9FUNG|nr:hypothetical protein H4R18_001343 [Coemansia javaensis]